MDAIKKKMQAMKLEKDNAADKADAMEGQAKDANARVDKLNEEVRVYTNKFTKTTEKFRLSAPRVAKETIPSGTRPSQHQEPAGTSQQGPRREGQSSGCCKFHLLNT